MCIRDRLGIFGRLQLQPFMAALPAGRILGFALPVPAATTAGKAALFIPLVGAASFFQYLSLIHI